MKKERKNRTRKEILVLVLLLVIGFASITTTLVINGTIKIGPKTDDLEKNLLFTAATLDYSDEAKTDINDNSLIKNDGKSIEFTVGNLTDIGETATIAYTISNRSQYDADITGVTCNVYQGTNDQGTDVTAKVVGTSATGEYIRLVSELDENTNIAAKTGTLPGTLRIEMIKSFIGTETSDTASYFVKCNINAVGVGATAPTEATPAA